MSGRASDQCNSESNSAPCLTFTPYCERVFSRHAQVRPHRRGPKYFQFGTEIALPAHMKAAIPQVGQTVRPVGSEILYRVVAASEYGCRVEAISDEYVPVTGRQPRKLPYNEKRHSLCATEFEGKPLLLDDQWRGWEVVS